MVVQYGLVVGFVVFGIGGLFRFRTALPSVAHTGRLILVTLVGLACGLRLPHLGVLATAFGFALIYWTDRTLTYHVRVKDLEPEQITGAAEAYGAIIARQGGRVIHEKRSFNKSQVTFLVQAPHRFRREELERAFAEQVPDALKGSVDWEID
jgi:hypothetical protein